MSGIGQGIVFKDAALEIDAVDLSTWVREATLSLTTEDIESTGMQATGKEFQSGDRVDSLEVKFKQDFSAAAVDATLFPIFEAGTHVDFTIRHASSAVGADNPEYRGNLRLNSYQPFNGARGALLEPSVTMPLNGAATRHTT